MHYKTTFTRATISLNNYMESGSEQSLVLSYLDLRKSVGAIGMALPFVLALGRMLLEAPGILASMSAYYYSVMGDVFVGSLCAIGVFLWSYRYGRIDAIAGHLACIFALGVAFFPTTPAVGATPHDVVIGIVHGISALGFFITLAFFALVLFRKTNPTQIPTPKKLQRNIVYTVCGYTILACVALDVALNFLPSGSAIFQFAPTFWLESIAVIAFGISWMVKGETILKDL